MAEEQTAPTYLIIGNGIAGATAAEILRAEDSAATIGVIADDPSPVYYRPALKDYLSGRIVEDKLGARPTSFYQDHMIRFLPERVVGIQPAQHRVQLQNGRQLGYNRLLLANGARPGRLNCSGQQLQGVYTLRSIADYQALLQNLNETRHVVVIGSGTLALETVETLRHRNYSVTHILRRRTIWSEVLDATASDLVLQQEQRDGVDVRLEEEVVEIFGSGGSVNGVVTRSGEQIACETVIIAIGIEPIIDFIKASGIACGRGVKVDSRMRTNTLDIYAAGDVIETTDQLTGRTRVLGQWYPAVQQARAAAYSMLDLLDNNVSFQTSTFYNATFLYGLDFASVGITNAPGLQEIVAEPRPRMYRKVLLKDGIPVGMLSLGNRKQALTFKRAIDHRVNLLPVTSVLFDDSFKFNEWLDRQGVPPPLLSVGRSGDAAIKRAAYPEGVATNTALEQRPLVEALLVPMDQTPGQVGETLLSQTKVLTVGRQPGVYLLIDEATVSRRQAEISYLNGQYILHDLGSSNGTFVNDVRLESSSTYVLKAKDIVRFGKVVKFTFVMRTIDKQAKKLSVNSPSQAGIPYRQEPEAGTGKLGQPVLKPDGSLLLPGAKVPLPARIVSTFKEAAALIVLAEDTTQEGNRPPTVFLLNDRKPTLLGREEGMDIELADPVVSRRHAEIVPDQAGFYIRDLGSSNGVLINQTKIDNPYRLSHGDHVSLGGYMLYFVDLRTMAQTTVRAPLPSMAERTEINRRPVAQGEKKAERRPQSASPVATQREREPVTRRQVVQQDSSKSASLPQLVVCSKCGGVNTRIARFCASCSAPLGSMV